MDIEKKKYNYLKFTKSLTEEYLLLQEKYSKIYNEDKTIVLMQVGSFHECYSTKDRGYDLYKLSDLMNIIVSKKNKKNPEVDVKNPYMMGFPTVATFKFVKILVDNGFYVIKIDQVTDPPNPKRAITGIYSPGTYIDDIKSDSNNILSIYLEEIKQFNNSYSLLIGMSIIDLSIGESIIHETFSHTNDEKYSLDETLKFIHNFNPKEIIINYKNLESYTEDYLVSYLELHNRTFLISEFKSNEYSKISYQNNFLDSIFKKESLLSNIEDLDLENCINGRLSFIILLNYCLKHNSSILNNISKPKFYNKTNYLHLGNNALDQLNIINYDKKLTSLFDIINYTETPMGKRLLNFNLCNPICDVNILNDRYDKIEELNKKKLNLSNELKNIIDIERYHRKISLQTLNPCDFVILHESYQTILKIFDKVKNTKLKNIFTNDIRNELQEYIRYYQNFYDFDEMQKFNLNDISNTFFKKNINSEIDLLQVEFNSNYQQIKMLKDKLEEFIDVKKKDYFNSNTAEEKTPIDIKYNDKEKYYLSTTMKRGKTIKLQLAKKKIKINDREFCVNEFKFKEQSTLMKISTDFIDNISSKIVILMDKLIPLIKNTYLKNLSDFYNKFNNLYKKINIVISEIDFINSGSICSIKNKYFKPVIKNENISFVDCKSIRHPIIEKIALNEYVPYDFNLNSKQRGILLYGLNSAGKSSLMKSIGLNVVLAQIGYFVSSEKFNYMPYTSIFTRISNTDNIYKGLSSFGLELFELNSILKRSGKNTLVLADEVCKGTEFNSALIIVSSMIKMLIDTNTSFISATHLHQLKDIELIKETNNLEIYNIAVRYENNNIIFDRKLVKGNGIEEYGLDFAKFMIKDKKFIEITTEIKKQITNSDFKKSRYNPKVIMNNCQICKSKNKLETHHIEFQKNTDENGFIIKNSKKHINKNHTSNLVVLCDKCHDCIHNNSLAVYGYENTIKGNILKYKKIKT